MLVQVGGFRRANNHLVVVHVFKVGWYACQHSNGTAVLWWRSQAGKMPQTLVKCWHSSWCHPIQWAAIPGSIPLNFLGNQNHCCICCGSSTASCPPLQPATFTTVVPLWSCVPTACPLYKSRSEDRPNARSLHKSPLSAISAPIGIVTKCGHLNFRPRSPCNCDTLTVKWV